MEALSALRKAFGLKKNEELGKKFDPITLKRITEAMKDYAAAKTREQRLSARKHSTRFTKQMTVIRCLSRCTI